MVQKTRKLHNKFHLFTSYVLHPKQLFRTTVGVKVSCPDCNTVHNLAVLEIVDCLVWWLFYCVLTIFLLLFTV